MKYLLILLYFILSAGAVNANAKALAVGDVFTCQMEAFVQWDWEKTELTGYQKEQFKFSIIAISYDASDFITAKCERL